MFPHFLRKNSARLNLLVLLLAITLPAVLSDRLLQPAQADGSKDQSGPKVVEASSAKTISEHYGKLPLRFERNEGQTDPAVKFIARGRGYGLFLTSTGAVLKLSSTAPPKSPDQKKKLLESQAPLPAASANVFMHFKGTRSDSHAVGLDEQPGKSNYFIGNEPKNWHTNVRVYSKVRYENLYPGIDLLYYGNQGQLELRLDSRAWHFTANEQNGH